MTQGSAHPPKARLVLRVGITGHRPNKLGERGTARYKAVADAVRDALLAIKTSLHKIAGTEALKEVYADAEPLLRIISALAEGADRMAAEEAVAPCSELQVILPFASDEYERDFETDASKEEFRALMARATVVMTLDGTRAAEDRAYRAAGRMMLRQSDVVIAVWDGKPAESDAGTGAIAADALRLGLPVVWINSRDPAADAVLLEAIGDPAAGEAHRTRPWASLAERLRALLLPPEEGGEEEAGNAGHWALPWRAYFAHGWPRWSFLGWFYSQFVALFSLQLIKFVVQFKCCWPFIVPALRLPSQDQRLSSAKHEGFTHGRLAEHYIWADQLADEYGAAHRGGYVLGFSLAPVAVSFAVLFLASTWTARFDAIWAVLELMTILLMLGLVIVAKSRQWHARWLEYRFLAEQLRQMRMLAPLGRVPRSMQAPAHHAFAAPEASLASWQFRAAVREAGLAAETLDHDRRWRLKTQVVLPLIRDQVTYHRLVKKRHARVAKVLHITHLGLFAATLGVVAWHVGHEWHHLMEWSFDPPTAFQPKPLNMLAAVLPAFGASIAARATQGEFHRLAERSEAMAERLGAIAQELEDLPDPSVAHLGDLAEEAADLMLAEVLDWRVMLLARPPELPA